MSIVLPDPHHAMTLFPLAVAVGLVHLLERKYQVFPSIKWPNDLLIVAEPSPPRKLAGVLVDRLGLPDHHHRLVVGIGVNVATCPGEFPEELRERVAFLSAFTPRSPAVREVEEDVAQAVQNVWEILERPHGGLEILRLAEQKLYGPGRRAIVDGRSIGVIRGLTPDGGLRVDTGAGELELLTGDLVVGERA
jgi:BirA family biotin operon repressor/biotin-[acetyl-CoA-carboxylase] ligase